MKPSTFSGQDHTAITIVVNRYGAPFTQDGFQSSFGKLIAGLREASTVREGLTFHGLRHTAGCALADAGCSEKEIAAILGITEQQARTYSDRGDATAQAAAGMIKLRTLLSKKVSKAASEANGK